MSTPYTTEVNKEANLQFNVSDIQRQIENIKFHISLIENTLSFTGLSISERNECEESLKEYKADLVKAENNLDEAMDALLGINEEEEEDPVWIIKPNLWHMLGM